MPDRDHVAPRPYPLRLYESATRRFFNFSRMIDVGKIYQESTLILKRLVEKGLIAKDAGAAIVTLDPTKLPKKPAG